MDTNMGMAMDMGTVMVRPVAEPARQPCGIIQRLGLIALLACLPWDVTPAGSLDLEPRLRLGEILTSNVELAGDGQEDWDLISVVAPGFRATGEGRRLQFRTDYELESLYFLESDDDTEINHKFLGQANAELVEDWLYADLDGQVSQRSIDTLGRVSLDNANRTNNRSDIRTLEFSPYLRHRFGGWAAAELRTAYRLFRSDAGGLADGDQTRYEARINSGTRFTRLRWAGSFRRSKWNREDTDNSTQESLAGNFDYALTPTLGLVGNAGRQENEFRTNQQIVDGSYWGLGLRWSPTRRVSVSALTGQRLTLATLDWRPSARTDLRLSYRDREVGLNPGAVWDANFNVRLRRSTWSIGYSEDTETQQGLLFLDADPITGELLIGIDPLTGEFFDPATGLPVLFGPDGALFVLNNEIIERRRGRINYRFNTARSVIGLGLFHEERTFLTSGEEGEQLGGQASWKWRFGARSELDLNAGARLTDFERFGGNSDVYYGGVTLSRSLTGRLQPQLVGVPSVLRPGLRVALSYRYLTQESSLIDTFEEHRLSLFLTARF